MDIIQYLLSVIQYLYQQNCWLISFICRYIPLKQWAFDDSHSPKYQKFKVDELPKVQIIQQEWDWRLLIPYFERRYGVKIKPVSRRKECDIPEDCSCPSCGAPQPYLYRNNGKAGQLKCKVCNTNFSPDENRFAKQFTLRCPHCGKALVAKKERKHFIIHKCVNPKCPYYLHNLKKVDKDDLEEDYGKEKINFPGLAVEPITLGDDEYFVMGDNRNNSSDSRDPSVGNIRRSNIIGKAWVRIWPLNKFGVLKHQ